MKTTKKPITLAKAFCSPRELAQLADVSSDTIINYIHAGRIHAVQLSPRTYRIPQRVVARFLGIPVRPSRRIERTGTMEELEALIKELEFDEPTFGDEKESDGA